MTDGIIQKIFKKYQAIEDSNHAYLTEDLKQELIEKIRQEVMLNKSKLCEKDCDECYVTKLILQKLIGNNQE